MIKRVISDDELLGIWEDLRLSENRDNAEAMKIYALWRSYGTKYDFCRFYIADYAVICAQDGSFVVSETGKSDFEELARFFALNGFSDVFCSEKAGAALSEYLHCKCEKILLMRFEGTGVPCETEKDTALEDFYDILSTSFDIEFEPWYLDMSHRIRHGIARTRRLGGSVLVIQHELFGSALISQVATLPSERQKGGASRLISAVCAELAPSDVYVICSDDLCGFYQKNGFHKIGVKCVLISGRKLG